MSDEKGLKFYVVQTDEGPQFEHLQAEAKKRDPNFTVTFVDTAKQPLMERLNDLMRRANAGGSVTQEEGTDAVVRPAPPPPSPSRPPAVQARVERTYDQIGFEEFIQSVPADEEYRLDLLADMINARRDELAGTPKGKKK